MNRFSKPTLIALGLAAQLLTASASLAQSAAAGPYQPTWSSIDSRPVPTWFEDAKFGIFIHWGVYSVPAYSPTGRDKVGTYERYAEHYWRRWLTKSPSQKFFDDFHNRVYGPNVKYQDFARDFKAELFEPEQWADRFKGSGAQYVVLTSKHHEGFALWPSSLSWNWNAVDVGPHRDVLGDLTKAVQAKGLKMGYYYSLLEWYHPLYKKETINQYVDEHMIPQMKELVTRYKPDVFWTDGEWDYPSETLKSTQFLSWLYNDSPVKDRVVVNDRWGKETRSKHGGFFTTEYDLIHDDDSKGVTFERPWEECRGMAGSFGYNRNEVLEDYSTSEELIKILIDKVARGGNLLLNIGPTADGRIPVIMQQRLDDMGKWLSVNGEGIYSTRAWKNAPKVDKNTTTFFTTKGKDLYVITTKWADNLTIDGVKSPASVSLLGYKGPIKTSVKNGKLTLTAPTLTPTTTPCQYAWVYKLTGAVN
ncbi:alpha-L-fucosidase [Spirosoma sp. 209]|uniref:alpha-L-fucosidase n=1 Tax=Spirosoma sp. 209 TaxID=1955701 RepID=UPI00098D287B|nr:alpha-L-fucosidase [Spirosoma sp. 209]